MPIYTKTGDKGTTSLFGGKRLSKSDPRIHASGEVDELSSFIGLLIIKIPSERKFLTAVQKNLYIIMSVLSCAPVSYSGLETELKNTEKRIAQIEKKTPELRRFILPQGSEASAVAHIARSVCRRAERATIPIEPPAIIVKYLNRLSSYFFVLARLHNKHEVFAKR